jgi:hypothetical protein
VCGKGQFGSCCSVCDGCWFLESFGAVIALCGQKVEVFVLKQVESLLWLLLLLLFTAIGLSLGGSSPYTSTDKTNKNKYT